MKKKPNWLKKIDGITQKVSIDATRVLDRLGNKTSKQAKALDNDFNITKNVQSAAEKSRKLLSELDKKHALGDKAKQVGNEIEKVGKIITSSFENTGLGDNVQSAKELLAEKLIVPTTNYISETGIQDNIHSALTSLESAYGATRSYVKPYFAPVTPADLLISTKEELIYINSCILQISTDEAEKLANKLGTAVISKVAGVASVGALLSMVSTFGSAGTGTAISTLYGAAASNATLAWVGGLLGGGMATGAVLTGGVALVASVGVYQLISSEARQFEQLSEQEQRIIESTGFLIAAINDLLKNDSIHFDAVDAEILLNNTLKPLHQNLLENSDAITTNLDSKHSLLYRQHALVDFDKRVIDGFVHFIKHSENKKFRYPEFIIAGVFYALLTRTVVDASDESQIALEAIRRMKKDWSDVTESELSDYLSAYNSEQLKGIANNVKGIYHELLFVDQYNSQNTDTYAALFEQTNHPGADVQILWKDNDQVLHEFQLKASDNSSYIANHFEKYPDIELLATDELANTLEHLASSGISNSEITENINQIIEKISMNTVSDRMFNSMGLTALASAGKEAINILNMKQDFAGAGAEVMKTAAVASASTLIASYLFS